MKTVKDVKYGEFRENYLNIYLPESEKFDLVVWFHGGGLESGDRKREGLAAEHLKHGLAFASVEYRMYPNAKFPDFIEDAAAAVAFLQKSPLTKPFVNRMFVSGQSAGAYLAMMLCVAPDFLKNAGADADLIDGFISDSAQQTTHFNVLRERGLDTRIERIDEAAPLFYVNENLSVKPLLMLYYKDDMPARPEQNKLMYKSLKRFLPQNDIRLEELEGTHCSGSSERESDGSFRYISHLINFINSLD